MRFIHPTTNKWFWETGSFPWKEDMKTNYRSVFKGNLEILVSISPETGATQRVACLNPSKRIAVRLLGHKSRKANSIVKNWKPDKILIKPPSFFLNL